MSFLDWLFERIDHGLTIFIIAIVYSNALGVLIGIDLIRFNLCMVPWWAIMSIVWHIAIKVMKSKENENEKE